MKETPIKVAPSLLSADFSRLGEEVRRVEERGADWIHFDVMDNHFVPALTVGPAVAEALRPHTSLLLDVHLMVHDPESLLEPFARAGAGCITVHAEAAVHLHRVLQRIRRLGVMAGVALNPATSPAVLEYVWDLVDLVLVMSVNPGAAGQAFLPAVLHKIELIAAQIRRLGRPVELQVDGGIDRETAPAVIAAGATVLVAGSAIFGAPEGLELIRAFKLMNRARPV